MPKNLEVSIEIAASPERVWAVVSDLKRMPEFSPQCVRMLPLGTPKTGTWTININRDGKKFWPTTARIVRYEPNQAFAFRINENRSVWSYTLEPTASGTRLIERRDVPNGTTWLSRTAVNAALGGEQPFEELLVRGMNETLDKIKTAVEAGR
ncbi:SRPBCC family protein [Nocardia donostiensis]|uniref:Polyketide cyclase n=1 Tax=Nocardia donostiensis TaxID=1538463 RepID=A0A1V2TDV3_9NOCA|nr:SRPBCC family protein [Nocardia donostiensis]ONM47679.1 polyketide cyclase [Nocardia donostiensis]OQS15266.1 polyketide cyclase [Nocardia donostiensis]OQS24352.1 polyketide cyclase [Nocardia donostiensis]